MTIVLLSSRTKLIRFGLWTIPATPCAGAIVRKPRGRSSSRTTLAVPADNLLNLLDVMTGAITAKLTGWRFREALFSPDNQYLVSLLERPTVSKLRIWSLTTKLSFP